MKRPLSWLTIQLSLFLFNCSYHSKRKGHGEAPGCEAKGFEITFLMPSGQEKEREMSSTCALYFKYL